MSTKEIGTLDITPSSLVLLKCAQEQSHSQTHGEPTSVFSKEWFSSINNSPLPIAPQHIVGSGEHPPHLRWGFDWLDIV